VAPGDSPNKNACLKRNRTGKVMATTVWLPGKVDAALFKERRKKSVE